MRLQSVFLLIICTWLAACSPSGPVIGEKAPDFVVQTLDGQQHKLSAYRGKTVLLHFWTDWCESCRKEFPKIQAYYQTLGGADFEVLAVNVGQSADVVRSFQQEFGVTFPMALDPQGTLGQQYEVRAYPTNYVINPEGIVIRRIVGWVDKPQVESILYNLRTSN